MRFLGAGFASGRPLFLCRRQSEDARAQLPCDLHEQQTDAAGRRVHENIVPLRYRITVAHEVLRREPLQQQRRRRLERHAVRQRDELLDRDRHELRVRIGAIRKGDAVTDRKRVNRRL